MSQSYLDRALNVSRAVAEPPAMHIQDKERPNKEAAKLLSRPQSERRNDVQALSYTSCLTNGKNAAGPD